MSAPVPAAQAGPATSVTSAPSPTVAPSPVAPPSATAEIAGAPSSGSGSVTAVTVSRPPPSAGRASSPIVGPTTTTTAPAPDVACQTNLSLAQSPPTPYNFLCRQNGTPLTWSTDRIVVFDSGLSTLQKVALPAAVLQWEDDGQFTVTYTSAAAAADVVITTAPLNAGEAGYTEDGYTTVSYRCDPHCSYDHANVVLSSTATLTQTDWLSTILHELGHVAGLNHVAEPDEIMYPYLNALSPVAYASGDREGLAILAAER